MCPKIHHILYIVMDETMKFTTLMYEFLVFGERNHILLFC
jgi:hypothetical protein